MGKNSELLKEKLPHGNVLFPLMVHEVSSNPKITERLACHWHTEYEFLVITKGCAQFQIENQIIPVKENDIVFIKSDDLHAITTTCGMPLDFYAIVFHPDLLNSHLGDAIWQKYIEPVNTGLLFFPSYISPNENWGMALLQNLNKIKDLFERKEMGYELLIKCAIYEIWYILYTHAAQNISAHEKDQTHKITRIKSMITWLQAITLNLFL
ncbi:AraC family ligand binding domain-containing protein [Cellulosilyticum ruminicola]|uniref:AraC family ligand binding domain-containing protein n=1 Tax=Cellulosilyticum ruminicola TaxID=425254 RepID=UPI0006D0B78E|nr:AraC family ligand binding domain-containing protein [Cellulosilyticum ruminicola]